MSAKPSYPVVRITRIIPAPPRDVFQAWLEPDLLRKWLAPGGLEVSRLELDARVGGRYRVWHSDAGSDVGGFDCEIVELVPEQHIAFRWGFVGPDRTKGPVYDSRLAVTFRKAPGNATELTLIHERLEELAAALPEVADNVQTGWALVLDKLAAMIRPGALAASGGHDVTSAA